MTRKSMTPLDVGAMLLLCCVVGSVVAYRRAKIRELQAKGGDRDITFTKLSQQTAIERAL